MAPARAPSCRHLPGYPPNYRAVASLLRNPVDDGPLSQAIVLECVGAGATMHLAAMSHVALLGPPPTGQKAAAVGGPGKGGGRGGEGEDGEDGERATGETRSEVCLGSLMVKLAERLGPGTMRQTWCEANGRFSHGQERKSGSGGTLPKGIGGARGTGYSDGSGDTAMMSAFKKRQLAAHEVDVAVADLLKDVNQCLKDVVGAFPESPR